VADNIGGIYKVAFGALDAYIVANLEEGDMAGNVTLFISLETRVEVWGTGQKERRVTLMMRSKRPRSSSLLMGV
jgi:hypothetical protein